MSAVSVLNDSLPFPVISYLTQEKTWPKDGRHIIASYTDDSIIVYQAYRQSIANAAVKANNFHSDEVANAGYSLERMTWIKTNFLWMMYRSGWATKVGQENILAIRISSKGFDEILQQASTHGGGCVRLQWDPDHTPSGVKVIGRRAIQLGLRGEMLHKFSKEFIIKITDITDFVREQANNLSEIEKLQIPAEIVYSGCSAEAAKNVCID